MLDSIRQAPGPKRPVLLSFGCSSAAGFFYRDELELREAWMPNLTLLLSADQVADDDRLLAGTPLSVLPDGAVTADSVAYLCGPPGMIEAARQRLVGLGLSRENIRSESFTPSG
jgi:benzoate/toluate 1,2-dioxygenase reductase subunit